MDFKMIEYICAINDAKTISQAAKNLFISQPALSQQLSKAEQELGIPIFVRSGNKMVPTLAGEMLIREGREMLMAREKMMGQLTHLSIGQMETVRFGISPFYSKYYLPILLSHFQKKCPHVKLQIVEEISSRLEEMLINGQLNLAFLPTEPPKLGLQYQPIYIEEIFIGIPVDHSANAYAIPAPERSYLDLTRLRNEPFICMNSPQKFHSMSQRILRHFSIKPDIVFETPNWDTICFMVAGGVGVGFLPDVLIHKHLQEPNFYRIAGIDATLTYAAVYAEGKRLSHFELMLVETFMGVLKEQSHAKRNLPLR